MAANPLCSDSGASTKQVDDVRTTSDELVDDEDEDNVYLQTEEIHIQPGTSSGSSLSLRPSDDQETAAQNVTSLFPSLIEQQIVSIRSCQGMFILFTNISLSPLFSEKNGEEPCKSKF